MKVSVPAEGLRIPKAGSEGPAASFDSRTVASDKSGGSARRRAPKDSLTLQRTMTMSTEIQLLGQTVEEALQNLDKYLDDAVLAGLTSVRIVHGKGTGALRAAVGQYLKRDPRVRTYRLGSFGEGDNGVTLADLK